MNEQLAIADAAPAHGRCRSCAAPVRWVVTAAGKRMPIDREPSLARGNILVDGDTGEARVLTERERDELVLLDVPLYVSHFATCPNADDHRRAS